MLALLGGVFWTYTLPVIKVGLPPLGAKEISAWSLTKPAIKPLQGAFKGKGDKKKKSGSDSDFNFMELLEKVLPKSEKTGKAQKVSITFIAGILVPVAIILAYALLVVYLLLSLLGGFRLLKPISFAALGASLYGLVGTYFLSAAGQRSFQQALDQKAGGLFGAISKNFVPKISIEPGVALYLLCGLTFCIVAAHAIGLATKK